VQIADQYRTAAAGFDMSDAAQDQRADDPFAQLGFGDDQGVRPIGRNQQRFDPRRRRPPRRRSRAERPRR
jgi:hypothetical protein